MTDNLSGLIYAHILSENVSKELRTWSDVENWQAANGKLWIHLDAVSEQAIDWLSNKSGLSPLILEALVELGTRPRCVVFDSGILVILRGVNCNPGGAPEDMVAIRMFLSDERIISMRRSRVMAVQDVNQTLLSGHGPASVGQLFIAVVDRITDRIGEIVANIEDRVADIEDTIISEETAELRPRLAEVRRESILLRRYIAPQRDMLSRLILERISWLTEADKVLLREIAERTARFVEDIDAARDRASIAQEELNSRLSEQMNEAMYTLSIVAAIILPLGLLTGLLGINVGGIPGTDSPIAFLIVTILLLILAVLLVAWFRKIKWL